MKTLYLLPLILLTSLLTANAQSLTSSAPVYDCGQVLFRSPISVKYTLRNNGPKTVTIKKIETSCGCTTAKVRHKNVGSGKDLVLTATYDAKLLGHFNKQVWIYEEGQADPIELTLKGVVVTSIKDYSNSYPYQLGQIRSTSDEVEFDNVKSGAMPSTSFDILNTTGETIEPTIMHLPEYLRAEITPARIAPDQKATVSLILLSNKIRNMGLTQTSVYLGKFAGDKISADKEIPVSVVLIPSNQDLTNIATAPKIQLSATQVKLSDMSGNRDKLKTEIIIQNVGHSILDISSLQMFTSGLTVSLNKSKLNPSESAKLKIQADANEIEMLKARPRILMITNDPNNPKVIIEIQK